MFCGWEGNRRSAVTLAMRRRLSATYGLKGQCAGDEHAPTLHWSMVPLYSDYCQCDIDANYCE